jgi:hypothetical protein
MAPDDHLFSGVDWFSVEEHQKKELKNEVANYDGNRLLNTAVDDLRDYFEDKYRVDVPVLQPDAIVADQREAQVDVSHRFDYVTCGPGPHNVPGTTVEITIPFTGDHQAFTIRPSAYSLNPPRATVRNDSLVLVITGINMNADKLRSEIDSAIESIQEHLANLRKNAESLNASLGGIARVAIEARRQKLLANQNLVSSLGYAMKQRPDSPQTYTAPNVRRKLRPAPPPASSAPYRPEPSLTDQDYSHILDVIQNMAQVMECSPSAFSSMDEEALRTHFLVQLNGHYEGQATAETFNYEGKTDILIRADGRNIFIGECKFWGGPKKLTDTIDQLLGYSSWRDTKVAVLVFNRNKDFTKVLESIQSTVAAHANCKRVVGPQSETSFRYVFSHRDDANREMVLTVLAFDVPSA